MASTRPSADLGGYFPTFDRQGASTKRPASLQPSAMPLQPIENMATATGCILNPPSHGTLAPSPIKGHRRPASAHSGRGKLNFLPITAPSPPMFATDSPVKRHSLGDHHRRTPSLPLQAAFNTFPSIPSPYPQQHPLNAAFSNDSFADFPDPTCNVKPLKRTLMESAPLRDRPAKKQKRDDSAAFALPEPQEMPPVEDDGSKPPYSYATLIGMSILRAPSRKLTLAQIYKWISDTFSFYRSGDSGWQNSIRHNLSLNKAFVKQERPKDDPGKGNYWAIEPGMEAQFLKDKPVRRATLSSIPLPPTILQTEPHVFAPNPGTTTWRVPPPPPVPLQPAASVTKLQDLSSDATLPASDPALQEDSGDDEARGPTTQSHIPHSSPPQVIHSSPPVDASRFLRQGTPPTPSRPITSSAAVQRSRKRPSAAMNDSGYYSSLESSAMRSNKASHILTSDLDIEPPRIKRGRAEEEIARIRSSSHDISPVHSRVLKGPVDAAGSSPFRGEYMNLLPPPLTPVIKFKKPARPPRSLSPNTNLRNHRRKIQHMVNSPIKHLGLTDEDLPWSPAFKIHDETATPHENLHLRFDIFADATADVVSTPNYRSPTKRAPRRSLGDASSEYALADITTTSANKRLGPPLLSNKAKSLGLSDSPSKMPELARYTDTADDDFFSFSLFEDSPEQVDGVDLLQGFQKIGGVSKDDATTRGPGIRPHLSNRNNTSYF